MRNLIIFVFVCFWSMVDAQDKVLIMDSIFSTPIVGVNIFSGKVGTTTDVEGFFHIKKLSALSGNDSLTLSSVGYTTMKITLDELKKGGHILYMLPKSEPLEEVIVSSNPILSLENILFKELAPLKEGVFAFGAALVENKIYVIGGDNSIKDDYYDYYHWERYSNKLQIYDIENNNWHYSDLEFTPRAYHNIHYYNGKIYLIGGKRLALNPKLEYLNEEIEVYDLMLNTIFISKTNPHPAANFASSVYKDNIIVMGGSIRQDGIRKIYTNKTHLFNLATGYWYELEDMPYFKETKSIIIDDMIYQIGGVAQWPVRYINTYNITTGEHKQAWKLPYGLQRPALAYNDGIIYVYENGIILTYDVLSSQTHAYSIDLKLMYCEMIYRNDTLYLIGGVENNGELKMPSKRLFSISVDEFKKKKAYPMRKF